MHRPIGQNTGQGLSIAENLDWADTEADRLSTTQGQNFQRSILADVLDDHCDLIKVRHDPDGSFWITAGPSADDSNDIACPVNMRIVTEGGQLPQTNGLHLIFLAARAASIE